MTEHISFISKSVNHTLPDSVSNEYWRSLFYYNLYRFSIAIFLLTAGLSELSVGSLGSRDLQLFTITGAVYACLALLFAFMIHHGWLGYTIQSWLQIYIDLIIIVILIYASSGLGSGLEVMLFVTIAGAGILLGGRHALAAAALASLFLLTEHAYVILTHQRRLGGFTAHGFMGMGLFITAFVMHFLSMRLRRTEFTIERQQSDISDLSKLNEYVIEQLDSGIILVGADDRIRLINARGREMTEQSDGETTGQKLSEYSPILMNAVAQWRDKHESDRHRLTLPSGITILASINPIHGGNNGGTVILMDDISDLESQQQNEKLMAMGRLSASIAHEIRNPLGAISHAGQLLGESSTLNTEEKRLVEIIYKQSGRINQIIETILDLGKISPNTSSPTNLLNWLDEIAERFILENDLTDDCIIVSGEPSCMACFDASQMRLVLNNLCRNALEHADKDKPPFIKLEANFDTTSRRPVIRVFDSGKGIDISIHDRIFEPFFTTSSTGNGLGLFIARRICLNNQGVLDYFSEPGKPPHFRLLLTYAKPCEESTAPE